MSQITKLALSGSPSGGGRGIKVVQTATAGTLIHTTNGFDELWLWAFNSHTASLLLTLEFGGVTAPDDNIQFMVPARDGLYMLVPGLVLASGVNVRAFCGTANLVMIHGFVHRIVG